MDAAASTRPKKGDLHSGTWIVLLSQGLTTPRRHRDASLKLSDKADTEDAPESKETSVCVSVVEVSSQKSFWGRCPHLVVEGKSKGPRVGRLLT